MQHIYVLIFLSFGQGHEILIIIGWGTMLPMGVIVARYFKEFPTTCNEWYQLHIMLQSVGYILGTVGWAIGISLGNTSRQSAYKTQRILSTIVFTLTTIQVSPNPFHFHFIVYIRFHSIKRYICCLYCHIIESFCTMWHHMDR